MLLEVLNMKLNKVKLGTLIELINDTNFDLKYGKKMLWE